MERQIEVPVLIVGGGIVGLSSSLFLSKLGVRTLLVERHSGTSIHPRARGFNVRTMELFQGLGIDDAVRDAGAELSSSAGIFRGHSLVEVIEPQARSREGGGRAGMPGEGFVRTVSPTVGARGTQDLVEPVLLQAARADPKADIRFNTDYQGVQQDDSGVTATIQDRESGQKSTVRAEYMIAADGAGSPVRRELGISTTGRGVLGNLINVLFEADLHELVRGREFSICVIDRPEVLGLFTSINNSDRWVFHLSYDPARGQKPEDFPPERCIELIKLALGMPDVDIKIKSRLPWQSAVHVAESFRRDRIFLAGDAAHAMPPWRGFGATTGIADVHNLSWKLAAVLNNQAGEQLLDTYETERLSLGRLVADVSGAAADEHGLFAVGSKIALIVQMLPKAPLVMGYGFRYQSSAVVCENVSFRLPWHPTAWILDLIGRPGTRVPHLWVQQSGKKISTVEICKERFLILTGESGEDWRKAAQSVSDRLALELPVYTIGPAGDLVDSKNQWLSLVGTSSGGALLVRPDGFVAWRSDYAVSAAAEKLHDVMQRILFS